MRYLSGCTSKHYEDDIIGLGVGLLVQPGNGYLNRVPRFPAWAADNGRCKIINGEAALNPDWTCAAWWMLGAIHDLGGGEAMRCLFALVPDTPCSHAATLRDFETYAPLLRPFGLPLAFAIQDGATVGTVPWAHFDVAFLAGSTGWKCGEPAMEMAFAARSRDKWVHMGRVNSWDRLDWASRIGCDSADGTFMRHGPPAKMVAQVRAWLEANQPRLTQRQAVSA